MHRLDQKLYKKLQPLLLIMIALSLGLFAWYCGETILKNRSAFENDVRIASPIVRAEMEAIVIRMKDTAAFLAAGAENKLKHTVVVPTMYSSHMERLGFFRFSDPGAVTALFGAPLDLAAAPADSIARLKKQLVAQVGLIHSLGSVARPELLAGVPSENIVLMQAMPIGSAPGDYGVVYAEVDIHGLINDATNRLKHSTIVDISYFFEGSRHVHDIAADPETLADRIFAPASQQVDIPLTRTLTLTATLRGRTDVLVPLFCMLIGVAAIGITVGMLEFVIRRIRDDAQRQLRAALTEAQNGNEAKSVFLANMSHEIRTPLNGVLGMAELLGRTVLAESQLRYVRQIKSSGNTLLAILNDILDLSKIESGQLAIDPVRTRLPYLLSDIASFYGPTADHKKLDLLLDVDPRLPEYVEVDPTRLRQILNNLLSNALKFTKSGEVVLTATALSLDAVANRCTIEFSVRDSGIGISDEAVQKLFNRFTQAQSDTTRIYGGTGLGLSICKELCELMGGSIGVTSEAGVGSRFAFTLSLPVADMTGVDAENGAPLRAAVVSSSASLNELLARGLPARGVEIEVFAMTTRAGNEIAPRHALAPFDFVVIDEGRRVEHASAIRERLRRADGLADIPCIVLGRQQDDAEYAAFSSAVVKPFDCRMLVFTMRKLKERGGAGDDPLASTILAQPRRRSFGGLRALLVDDNSVNLLFGTEILEDLGFEVVSTTNGAKAVEAVAKVEFDVVFMDCQMPVMDGYEATRRIRALMAEGAVRRVPIVAVTANALKGDREKCLDAGMDAFVTKPMRVHDLENTLDDLLADRSRLGSSAPRTEGAAVAPARGTAPAARPSPARGDPALAVPASPRPAPTQAAAAQPVAAQPVAAQPVAAQPVAAQPAAARPVAAQPVTAQPAAAQPAAAQPVAAQPVAAQPAAARPVAAQPVTAQPAVVRPAAAQAPEAQRVASPVEPGVAAQPGAAKPVAAPAVAAQPAAVRAEPQQPVPVRPVSDSAAPVCPVAAIEAGPQPMELARITPMRIEVTREEAVRRGLIAADPTSPRARSEPVREVVQPSPVDALRGQVSLSERARFELTLGEPPRPAGPSMPEWAEPQQIETVRYEPPLPRPAGAQSLSELARFDATFGELARSVPAQHDPSRPAAPVTEPEPFFDLGRSGATPRELDLTPARPMDLARQGPRLIEPARTLPALDLARADEGFAPGRVAPRFIEPARAELDLSSRSAPAPADLPWPAAPEAAEPVRPGSQFLAPLPAAAAPRADLAPAPAALPEPGARKKIPLIDVPALMEAKASVSRFELLLDFYRNDTAEYLEQIRSSLALDNVADAVMPAHTIKSSSRIVGAAGLAHLAESFETRARTGAMQVHELTALSQQMDRIFALTLTALDKTLAADASAPGQAVARR